MAKKYAKQVMRSGAKLLSSQIFGSFISVGFTIFLARVLSKTDFATFAVFGILAGLIRMTVSLGLGTTCIQCAPALIAKGQNNEASAMLKTSLLSHTILSAFFALLIFSFSTTLSKMFLKTGDYDYIIQIMSLGILFSSLNDCLGLLAQTTQQFGKISIIRLIVNISSRVFSIGLYFALGLKGYVIGFTWTPIVGIIFYLFILRNYLFVKSTFHPWFDLVKHSLPFYGRGFVRFGSMQFDQLIIGLFLQPAALSTYFIARKFSEYIFMMSSAVGEPILIKISELKNEGLDQSLIVFKKLSRYYSFLFVPICCGVAAISYPLLHLYGGYRYTDGTFILIILSLGMLMYVFRAVYGMNLFIHGKPKEVFKVDGVGALVNTVFALILIYFVEATGIALAKLLAFTASLFYVRHLLRKIMPVEFDKKGLKGSFIASACMAAVIVVLQLIYYNLLVIPLYILAGLITFMVILRPTIERRDIELVEDFLPGRFKCLVKVFFGKEKEMKFA